MFKLEEHYKFGDAQSLSISMYAGDEFAKGGFYNHAFNPLIQSMGGGSCCSYNYYTHFPPLTNILSGLVSKHVGKSLFAFRIVYSLLSFFSIFLLYLGILNIFNFEIAFITTIIILCNKVFWMLSSTQVYDLALFFYYGEIAIIAYLLKRKNVKNQKFLKIMLWCCLFFNLLSSFEYVVSSYILLCFYLLNYSRKNLKSMLKGLAVYGSAPVVAFLLKFFANSIVMGGIQKTLFDKWDTLLWRTLESSRGTNYISDILKGETYFNYIFKNITKYYFLNSELFISTLLLLSFVFWTQYKKSKSSQYVTFFLYFFIASTSWYLLFKQHSVIHINSLVIRHFLACFSLLISILLINSLKFFFTENIFVSKLKLFTQVGVVTICLLLINYNVSSFLKSKREIRKLTWEKEVDSLIKIEEFISGRNLKLKSVCTNDKEILRAKFLHMPSYNFGLSDYNLYFKADFSDCEYGDIVLFNDTKKVESLVSQKFSKVHGTNYSLLIGN